MDSSLEGRFPNLNQTKSKHVLSYYHDCMLRVFDNHASRKSDYLGNVLLSTAKSGDSSRLCKSLEKVDLNKVDFNIRERNTENTPLIVAAENGHVQIISLLLSCGSDVTLKNAAGQTVLEVAPEKITELILDSVNRPGAGQPLLCQAAWQGNATVVKKILCLNPNLNVNNKNSEGFTPLLLVTRDLDFFDGIKLKVFTENYNPAEVVSLLLHQNADCSALDNEGRSPLHLAARNHGRNARNIISLLAKKDSLDVDQRDTQKYSALHCASETGDPNVMMALIDNGADVNARADLGRTPLHMTASRGDEKTSELLVEHGANVLLVDDLGFTPIDVANGNGVQLLLKEAWSEHSQNSLNLLRVKSAPVGVPTKLDHIDAPDIIVNEDDPQKGIKSIGNKEGLRKLSNRKLSSPLSSKEHIRERSQNYGATGRTRSHSSGPSSHSRLDAMNHDVHRLSFDGGSASPLQKITKDSATKRCKSPQPDAIPRATAKVAVLNIDLKGHDLQKQKSKSCSELPFPRYRLRKSANPQNLQNPPNPQALSAEVKPLNNPLSLRGRSVMSSFETLPDIMSEKSVDEASPDKCETATSSEPELVTTPPPVFNPTSDELAPWTCSPDNDFLNKTFNSKEKPVFWFPVVQNDTKSTSKVQDSDLTFFVDLKDIETPLRKCTKCREEFTSKDFRPGTSVCNMCHRKSIAKDTFWVPLDSTGPSTTKTEMHDLDDGNTLTGTRSSSLDNRTVSIDRETLSVLSNKELSEEELKKSPKAKQNIKDTMSDSSKTQKRLEVDTNATTQQETAENSANVIREQCDDFASDDRVGLGVASTKREESTDCSGKREQPVCGGEDRRKSAIFLRNNLQSEETEPNIDGNETLIESQKSIKGDISNERSPDDMPEKKLHASTAMFELCKQTLECFSADLTCLESNNVSSDAINHLYNRSSVGKCPLVDQSTGEEGQSGGRGVVISPEVDRVQKLISNDIQQNSGTFGEFVDADVTPHQVVIVNPFPSPVPPKVPMVNVSSNCKCDRYASLSRTSASGGKKKGRGKRSGSNGQKTGTNSQNSESNIQKTGNKFKKAGQKDTEKSSEKGKQGKRVISAKKNAKKKLLQTPVKEIPVIQTALIAADTDEKKELLPQNTDKSLHLAETNIPLAPVRQTTFIKAKLPVLSPIPEASRSGSSVQGSSNEGFPSLPLNAEQGSSIPLVEKLDRFSIGHVEDEVDRPWKPGNEANLVEPMASHTPSVDVSQSQKSENKLETADSLEDLIQIILSETDELEKNHARLDVARKTSSDEHAELGTETNVSDNVQTGATERVFHSKNDIDESKKNFVEAWIYGYCKANPHYPSGQPDHGDSSSALVRATPSDANPRNASYESSGSTPLPPTTTDFSSEISRSVDDSMESTSGSDGDMRKSKVEAGSEKISQKPVDSDITDVTFDPADDITGAKEDRRISNATTSTFSEGSSMTIPLPPGSTASGVGSQSFGNESPHVIISRLTPRKPETPGTGSETISSEEEEIVWRKGNMLGRGAFGKVFCGLTNTGQIIAVKQVELITSDMTEAERQYAKLQEEVALLKSLRHENVVSYLGTCLDGGVVNIFMQFVPGGSIASILARFGPLEERVFRFYTKQILVGVEYLHSNNVVHRDIKGGNIMLMPTGVIKLIDFGCAKRLYINTSQSQGDLLRSMKGTPYWMAPEVIKETGYGRKSDIWSIGCTVFEMATGKPPWSHLPPISAILAIGQGSEPPQLEMLKSASEEAYSFVATSMSRDPDERWSADQLISHPFILQCDGNR